MQDPYLDDSLCIERLYNEYLKHKKLFICVDFDDTFFDFHKKGYTYPKLIEIIKECQELGFYIIIFTGSEPEKYPFIMEHCKSIGIYPHKINENAIPMSIGNNGKPYFNILLDDRANLVGAYRILRTVLDKIKENNK